ncbi:MAG: hypothetical protein M3141_06835 [Actinomycetota bacterium]|nr:hypothetical protein [Actinomycetota bacterium]
MQARQLVGLDVTGGTANKLVAFDSATPSVITAELHVSGLQAGERLLGIDYGATGDDVLSDTAGNDTMRGDSGSDDLAGGEDGDEVDAGSGNDTARGGAGPDTVIVRDDHGGDDRLFGSDGDDQILGGPGRDQLNGGNQNDTLNSQDFPNEPDKNDCGPGTDTVLADGLDTSINCSP